MAGAFQGFGLAEKGDRLVRILWLSMLVVLPVTSSPLIVSIIGRTEVSPLYGLPLLLLFLIWLIPYLIRSGRFPLLSKPLMLFACCAMVAAAAATFLRLWPASGESFFVTSLRGLLTLGIGLVLYLVVSMFPQSPQDLRQAVRWLYLGAVIALFWASVQAVFVVPNKSIPMVISKIHALVSIRRLNDLRVVGLAYEPSWLADQIVVLYLPLWAASVAMRFSVFRFRKGILSIELLMLAWGLTVHFLTLSRVGLVSAFMILGVLALFRIWIASGQVGDWLRNRAAGKRFAGLSSHGRFVRLVLLALALLLLAILMLGVVYLASRIDKRIAQIFSTDYLLLIRNASDPFIAIARRLRYAERIVYWEAAFRTFTMHPLLGVGLENAGFFFKEHIIPIGYRLPEIIDIVNGGASLPNPRNLWIRLLAETGVVGFLLFTTWLLLVGIAGLKLWREHSGGVLGMIGFAGLLALVAQVVEGFSVDSFALPQLWILPAMVTASLMVASRAGRGGESR